MSTSAEDYAKAPKAQIEQRIHELEHQAFPLTADQEEDLANLKKALAKK